MEEIQGKYTELVFCICNYYLVAETVGLNFETPASFENIVC
jgi:hypothetical protein